MKKYLPVYLIVLLAVVLGIGIGLKEDKSIIKLEFVPMPVKVLSTVAYDAKWELKDSKKVYNIAGVEQVLVNLYQKDETELKAVLEDRHSYYDLELSLEGEPERLTALASDMNHDGTLELVLIADKGTTYKEVKIYTLDEGKWKCILASENLLHLDLNNDGLTELITTSMGSLPGYVWIYRWTGQHFEKSDVVKDLGNIYATLTSIDGKHVIESGKENNPSYYTYTDGNLSRIKKKRDK